MHESALTLFRVKLHRKFHPIVFVLLFQKVTLAFQHAGMLRRLHLRNSEPTALNFGSVNG